MFEIFRHEVHLARGPMACTSFVSRGLEALGQPELVLTLSTDLGQRYAPDVRGLFQALRELAQDGRTVHEMGLTVIGGPFGLRQLGIGYLPAQPLEKVPLPKNALTMQFAVQDEIELLQRTGIYRLATRLGYQEQFFPWPPWTDPFRAPLFTSEDLNQSLSCQMPCLWLPHAWFVYRPADGHLTIRLAPDIKSRLARLAEHPPEAPIALATRPASEAGARLVWLPQARQPAAITDGGGDGTLLTGGILILVPHAEERIQMVEDGYAVFLAQHQMQALREALQSGSNWEAPGLSVEWLGQAAVLSVSVLYQPDPVLQLRTRSDFVNYAKAVSDAVNVCVEAAPRATPTALSLAIAVKPGRQARFWFEGELPAGLSDRIASHLRTLPTPSVRGAVAFSHHFLLWGAAGPAPGAPAFLDQGGGPFHFLPRAWTEVGRNAGRSLTVPDEVLEVLWPD